MADGDRSIVFTVDIDEKIADKKLKTLVNSISKLELDLAKGQSDKNAISEQLQNASEQARKTEEDIARVQAAITQTVNERREVSSIGANPDTDRWNELGQKLQVLQAARDALTAKYQEQIGTVQQLSSAEADVENRMRTQTSELERQRAEATRIAQELARQGNETSRISVMHENVRAAVDKAKSAVAGLGRSILSAGKTAASSSPNFKRMFTTLLKYGLGIRSLYMLFRKLKQVTKDAVTSFAQTDEETKSTINDLKSALATLKASWGAAFAPILNAVGPIIKQLLSWLTSLINTVSQFIAVLSGKSSFKRAVKDTSAISDNMGGAASSAEDMKKTLMGIDEITKLDDPQSGGGGGASGAQYEEVDAVSDFAERLKAAFKAGDYRGIGAIIAEKMNDVISGIDTAGWAVRLSELLRHALQVGIGFLETFDAYGLGVKIRQFFENIDWAGITSDVCELIGALIGAVLSFAVGLLAEPFQRIRNYFADRIAEWKKDLPDNSASAGYAIIMGILQGIWDGLVGIGQWLYDNVFKPIYDGICNAFQIHSPSVVMMGAGQNIVQGLLNGMLEKWNTLRSTLQEKWNSLKSWWSGLSLGSFDFKTPHLQVAWEGLDSNSILARFLGITAIPHLSVSWYAKGGIVNGATLIGAGEKGAEAIVPLENTAWMNVVADKIMERMTGSNFLDKLANAFTSLPMPAMASGSIVPPRAYESGYNEKMQSMIDTMQNLINAMNDDRARPIVGTTNMYLDRKQIGSAVTEYQREKAKAWG